MREFIAGLATGVTGAALAAGLVWSLLRYREGTAPPPADLTPAPEQRQPDLSLVLAREPNPSNSRSLEPKHVLPEGARSERIVQVKIQPNAESLAIPATVKGTEITWLPRPFTLDLTLARMPDGGGRVVASTPDGAVVGGVDVPVSEPTGKKYSHVAGALYTPGGGYGAWYHRSLGERWVVGAQVRYAPVVGVSADAVLGWRW
jgi:uncharacterized protein YcfJ